MLQMRIKKWEKMVLQNTLHSQEPMTNKLCPLRIISFTKLQG